MEPTAPSLPQQTYKPAKKWHLPTDTPPPPPFTLSSALPADIATLDWSKAVGFVISESGSTGVFFVGWKGDADGVDRVAVLKGSTSAVADQFAYELALLANIRVPKVRTVWVEVDPEFENIKSTLTKLSKLHTDTYWGKRSRMFKLPVITVMEYVNGKDLEKIDEPDSLFKKDKAASQKIFRDIGRLVMLDTLINNTDRFPVIWRHKGNIGNILFTTDPSEPVVGIDQSVTANQLENSVGYMKRARELLEQMLLYDTGAPTPFVDQCREYIKVKRLYDVGRFGLREMWIGMMSGVCSICKNITTEKITLLHQTKEETVKRVCAILQEVDPSGWGLERVRVEFLSTILGIMNEYHKQINERLATVENEEGDGLWEEFLAEKSNITYGLDEEGLYNLFQAKK